MQETATGSAESVFEAIASESRSSVLLRERNEFDRLASPFENSIVLFGAGFLGRAILCGLRRAGVEPLAFADNNEKVWGTRVDGLPVLSADDAVARYRHRACFVVSIFNSSSARHQLQQLRCERVVPFAPLVWKYPEFLSPQLGIDLPHKVREQLKEIRAACDMLSDERSRREFCTQLAWRYWLRYDCLCPHLDLGEIYFPDDIIAPAEDEVFVDCGAFDGGTTRDFLRRRGRFGQIVAIEPDRCNRAALNTSLNTLPPGVRERITVLPFAVSNCNDTVSFNTTASMASGIMAAGAEQVECRKLDDVSWPAIPTFVKMDVEGAEVDALRGGASVIKKHLPVLAICLYHRNDDLWRVPAVIRTLSDEYELFIRRYAEEAWEMVCYAVPQHRLATKK